MDLDNFNIIRVLEKLRIEKNFSITDFTNGIMSRRTYTRILSNEAFIKLDHFTQLLDRIQMPALEFLSYTHNIIFMENINEYEIQSLIFEKRFDEAYALYQQAIKECRLLKTFNSGFPIAVMVMEEYKGILTRENMLRRLHAKVDLNNILASKVITDDSIDVLYFFSPFATKAQKQRIGNYFFEILIDKKGIVLGGQTENATLKSYALLLRYMDRSQANKNNVMRAISGAVDYTYRGFLNPFDIEVMYEVKLMNDIFNFTDLLNFYLISALATTNSLRIQEIRDAVMTPENIALYNRQAANLFSNMDQKALMLEIINDANKLLQNS